MFLSNKHNSVAKIYHLSSKIKYILSQDLFQKMWSVKTLVMNFKGEQKARLKVLIVHFCYLNVEIFVIKLDHTYQKGSLNLLLLIV